MSFIRIAAVFWAIVAAAECSGQEALQGRVVGVHDGDSITVLATGNREIKVRLAEIDAPENKQAFSQVSKQTLSELVFGKTVLLHVVTLDRYKRTVARVYAGSLDVNLEMVRRGAAWRYDKYSKDPAVLGAQEQARAAKRGLWIDPNPVPPWEWRKRK